MAEQKNYLKDLKDGNVKVSLMVNKKLYKEGNKIVYFSAILRVSRLP